MKKITPRSVSLLSGLSALGLALAASTTHAADLYWNQSAYRPSSTTYSGQFNTAGSWSTDAAGTTAWTTGAPTISDNLFFNSTPNNALGGSVAIESGNAAANSMTFNTTGNTVFSPNNNRVLTLGPGGITLNSTSGGVTFGTSSRSFPIELNATQSWTNHSSNTLAMRIVRASDTATGPVVLTLNATSTGNISLSSNGQGVTDSLNLANTLALVVDSSTSTDVVGSGEVILGGGATYTGGTTIKRGVLRANSAIGATTGEVKLGDTSGSAAAKLRVNSTGALANTLNVQAGNTGTNTLEFMNTGGGNWSGDIVLNNTLNVAVVSGANGAQITGAISGGGDLVKSQYNGDNSGGLTLSGDNTYTGDTIIDNGAFTLADGGTLTFEIGADGDSNSVTGTTTGAITFAGTFSFDLDGAALVDGNSWTIVASSLLDNASFASTFTVADFSETDGIWTNGSGFTFSELDGSLSYSAIPEPSTYAALVGAGVLGLGLLRRRRST